MQQGSTPHVPSGEELHLLDSPFFEIVERLEKPLVLEIWDSPYLQRVSEQIPGLMFGDMLERFGEKLLGFLRAQKNGVGIAANQVGLTYRLFVFEYQGIPIVACNPTLEVVGNGHSFEEEGCLSLPGIYQQVCRPNHVRMTFQYPTGDPGVLELHDFYAHVVQHEVDHLDGIMFFDKKNMPRNLRKDVERRWSKVRAARKR